MHDMCGKSAALYQPFQRLIPPLTRSNLSHHSHEISHRDPQVDVNQSGAGLGVPGKSSLRYVHLCPRKIIVMTNVLS